MSGSTFQLRRSNWKVKIENQFFFQFSRAAWAEQWQKYPHLYFNEYWSKIRYYFVRWCQSYRFTTLNNRRISITWVLSPFIRQKPVFSIDMTEKNFLVCISQFFCGVNQTDFFSKEFSLFPSAVFPFLFCQSFAERNEHWIYNSISLQHTFQTISKRPGIRWMQYWLFLIMPIVVVFW